MQYDVAATISEGDRVFDNILNENAINFQVINRQIFQISKDDMPLPKSSKENW